MLGEGKRVRQRRVASCSGLSKPIEGLGNFVPVQQLHSSAYDHAGTHDVGPFHAVLTHHIRSSLELENAN